MKLAIISSRGLYIDISKYIYENIIEIISGGAQGIDACAKKYATQNNIKFTELIPEYSKFGRNASLVRNIKLLILLMKFLRSGMESQKAQNFQSI